MSPPAKFVIAFFVGLLACGASAKAETNNPSVSAVQCQTEKVIGDFSACWSREMMSDSQRQVADCVSKSSSPVEFVFCATQRPLSAVEQRLADCALQSGGNLATTASCAGYGYLDRDQQRLAGCIVSNGTNLFSAAICAGGRNLSPEQAVVANCAIQTGGQPLAFVACVGGSTTTSELQKCLSIGIGGSSGCFSDNATVAATRIAWSGAEGGSKTVLNNSRQIFGGNNSVFNNPRQILGGEDSVLKGVKPTAPPPSILGTVGGHRVCIPWC